MATSSSSVTTYHAPTIPQGFEALTDRECYIPWPVIRDANVNIKRAIVDPIVVHHELLSFSLEFNLQKPTNDVFIDVEVAGLKTVLEDFMIVASVVVTPRSISKRFVSSDRSTWPDPEDAVEGAVRSNGRLASVYLSKVRCFSLRVEVLARGLCALGRGLESARRNTVLCDVILSVEGEDFPAHKAVLASWSPVFLKMFTEDFMEKKEGRVTLRDVRKDVFIKFLDFMYSERTSNWNGCEVELWEMADRYMVDILKFACERAMTLSLNDGNVLSVLKHAITKAFLPECIRQKAAEYVVLHWDAVTATEEWTDFRSEHPVIADVLRGGFTASDATRGSSKNRVKGMTTLDAIPPTSESSSSESDGSF